MRNIPFRARPGKALLKKRVSKVLWDLTFSEGHSILLWDGKASRYTRKLHYLGNFIPKVCRCTRQEVKEKLDI